MCASIAGMPSAYRLMNIWVVVAIAKVSMRLHSKHTVVRQFRTEDILNVFATAVALGIVAALSLLGRCEVPLSHGRWGGVVGTNVQKQLQSACRTTRKVIYYSGLWVASVLPQVPQNSARIALFPVAPDLS